ncbi:NAD(P)/FAD-dependent oxidoreductase [Leucobacter luti]|uniref:Glycine/D-amino acid oxidase-like deaminating enzyme n=1 Tax=Leucobacter luti TaxID=340320 RepID=A0A4Q7TG60_9MICO|nr:FAD-binding oxidoreductase [Leucobacter luti]MBL3699689.1 FAD-binding oxidoreductase [Leucobacter luti]RZT59465.1 glycine/D-amino acid oxidase-like deaminating enzyme [Leucobacter luti]
MKETAYWLDTAAPAVPTPPSDAGNDADVIVVGAGLTGLSCAYHLAQQGARVRVLEAHGVGWGASGRNGGMATTGLSISLSKAVARYGKERAVAMRQRYNDAIDLIEQISRDEGVDTEFRRAGLMNLAARESHVPHYQREATLITELTGHPAHFLDRDAVREEIGADRYFGGMIDPAGASVHPTKLLGALAAGALSRGALVHEHTPVTGRERTANGGHRVRTPRGEFTAPQLVVATGAYSKPPFGWLQRRFAPVGSFVIVTEPLGVDLAESLLPHRRVCSDSKELLNYFRLTEDNRLAFGGRARFLSRDVAADPKSGEILQREMVELFPQLHGVAVEYAWGGLVDISLDRMVHSGTRDGYWFSQGYTGHGVQMATYMGKILAGNVLGETDNPWAELNNPPIPGHVGWPWFVPVAGVYYAAVDRFSR